MDNLIVVFFNCPVARVTTAIKLTLAASFLRLLPRKLTNNLFHAYVAAVVT